MSEALNLSTESTRPVLTIDSQEYHLKLVDDLSFREAAFVQHASKRISELQAKVFDTEQYTDELAEEFEDKINRSCKTVLYDVPDEVYAQLRDQQKVKIIEAFSNAAGLVGDSEQQESQSEQSPDSNDSTEETQSAG